MDCTLRNITEGTSDDLRTPCEGLIVNGPTTRQSMVSYANDVGAALNEPFASGTFPLDSYFRGDSFPRHQSSYLDNTDDAGQRPNSHFVPSLLPTLFISPSTPPPPNCHDNRTSQGIWSPRPMSDDSSSLGSPAFPFTPSSPFSFHAGWNGEGSPASHGCTPETVDNTSYSSVDVDCFSGDSGDLFTTEQPGSLLLAPQYPHSSVLQFHSPYPVLASNSPIDTSRVSMDMGNLSIGINDIPPRAVSPLDLDSETFLDPAFLALPRLNRAHSATTELRHDRWALLGAREVVAGSDIPPISDGSRRLDRTRSAPTKRTSPYSRSSIKVEGDVQEHTSGAADISDLRSAVPSNLPAWSTAGIVKTVVASLNIKRANYRRRKREGKHICDICGDTFTAKWSLRRHVNSHTREVMLPCSQPNCDKWFLNPDDLKRHEKGQHHITHSAKSPPK